MSIVVQSTELLKHDTYRLCVGIVWRVDGESSPSRRQQTRSNVDISKAKEQISATGWALVTLQTPDRSWLRRIQQSWYNQRHPQGYNCSCKKLIHFPLVSFHIPDKVMTDFNSSQEKPYVMLKSDKNLTGNSRYEGFCIDLLKDVANLVGFQYTISIVKDGKYGVEDPDTKQWNGIVRELIDGASCDQYSLMGFVFRLSPTSSPLYTNTTLR